MADVSPNPVLYPAMLTVAWRQSQELSSHAPAEIALDRMRGRVASAHQRLVADRAGYGDQTLDAQAAARLSERALDLAAALIRSLNDCLGHGLSGYVAITPERLPGQINELSGPPRTSFDAGGDDDVDGWLAVLAGRLHDVADPRSTPETIVAQAFGAVGAAAALATSLAQRTAA